MRLKEGYLRNRKNIHFVGKKARVRARPEKVDFPVIVKKAWKTLGKAWERS